MYINCGLNCTDLSETIKENDIICYKKYLFHMYCRLQTFSSLIDLKSLCISLLNRISPCYKSLPIYRKQTKPVIQEIIPCTIHTSHILLKQPDLSIPSSVPFPVCFLMLVSVSICFLVLLSVSMVSVFVPVFIFWTSVPRMSNWTSGPRPLKKHDYIEILIYIHTDIIMPFKRRFCYNSEENVI